MTLHAAKGLEFPVVFLPGWEDGLFPSQRSMDESGLKGLEEERRLAYVGITRAEELCTISFASNRRVYGQWQSQLPIRFIDELPAAHVEVLTPPGLVWRRLWRCGARHGGGSALEERPSRPMSTTRPAGSGCRTAPRTRPIASRARPQHGDRRRGGVVPYALGDRVFHQKFGYGEIMAASRATSWTSSSTMPGRRRSSRAG